MLHKRTPAILLIFIILILWGLMAMKGLEHKKFYVPTIPYWWHLIASSLPGKSHAVGCQLWFCYRTAFRSKFPVKLSRQYFSLMKFDRWSVWRALVELEKAGLITIKKGKGKAPLVTITLDPKRVSVLRKEWAERELH
jgi:hypothetical protein